jgi:hypothetical protein
MNASRLVALFALGVLAATTVPARAQQDPGAPAVAQSARRAREQKAAAAHPAQVWTNDNIPTTPRSINVIGQAESATPSGEAVPEKPADAGAAPAAGPEAKPADSDADKDKEMERGGAEAELTEARARLESLKTDYDLLERTYVLDQQTYYGKPGFASDKEGKDHLDAEERDLAAKRDEVKQAEQKVQELERRVNEKAKPAEEKPAAPVTPPPSQ